MKTRLMIALIMTVGLTGCLVTRDQVREGKKIEVSPEQQARANTELRFQELDETLRQMNGRIETIENSVNVLNAQNQGSSVEKQSEKQALTDRLKAYEESIVKLETQVATLEQKLDVMSRMNQSSKEATSVGPALSSFDQGEADFSKKNWKQAIISYEKYREKNPNGKRYADATYKIGVSFQELGMKTEAKTFYSEVVERFPKSDSAKRARDRLKSL